MTRYVVALLGLALAIPAATAHAGVVRVPADRATIQEAVETASPGDTIEVGAGRWCGASINKPVNLVGREDAVIVGRTDAAVCGGATTGGTLKIGFSLSSSASGTTVRHFTFDGRTAGDDPNALAIAVYGVGASNVSLEHNKVLGTLVAFNNTGGSGWSIRHNHLRGLTTRGGVGGSGIVVSQQAGSTSRPADTVIAHNHVEGTVPSFVIMAPGLPDPKGRFAAVRLAGVNGADLSHNHYRLAASDGALKGVGVFVTEGPMSSNGGGSRGNGGGSTPGLPSAGVELTHEMGKQADYLAVILPGSSATIRQSHGTYLENGEEKTASPKGGVAAGDQPGKGKAQAAR